MGMTDHTKKFYEEFHTAKTINPVAEFMLIDKCNFLRSLLKGITGKILVIGCGSRNEMSIINEGCEGFGIDISEMAIKKSMEMHPRFTYYVASATDLPFPDDSFDCIVCSEVIEHISEDVKVYSEVRRTLKNKGTFIITTPNWLSWYGMFRKIAEILFKKPFTADDQPIDNWSTSFILREKLKKYGFKKVILFRGIWYYPPTGKGNKQIPSKITLPIIKLIYPFEILFRIVLPWFGHMILFKTQVFKNGEEL